MPHESLSTPGQRLRFMRRARGLTQLSLARRLHTSQPAVSQWENDRWLPSYAMQRLIAEDLGTSRAFLFGDLDEQVAS